MESHPSNGDIFRQQHAENPKCRWHQSKHQRKSTKQPPCVSSSLNRVSNQEGECEAGDRGETEEESDENRPPGQASPITRWDASDRRNNVQSTDPK